MINSFGAECEFQLSFEQWGMTIPNWFDLPHHVPSSIEITIAIPNFNRAPILEAMVKSITVQTFPKEHYEILIVDDASDDDSIDVLHAIVEKYNEYNIKVIPLRYTRTYNAGHPWNVAMKNSLGWIFMFYQPDLIMCSQDVLQAAWQHHHARDNLFLCPICYTDESPIVENCIREGRYVDVPQHANQLRASADDETMNRFGFAFPQINSASIRKEYLLRIHGFDERYKHEPPEICMQSRLTRLGIVWGAEYNTPIFHRGFLRARDNPPKEVPQWDPEDIVKNKEGWGELTEEEKNIFTSGTYPK